MRSALPGGPPDDERAHVRQHGRKPDDRGLERFGERGLAGGELLPPCPVHAARGAGGGHARTQVADDGAVSAAGGAQRDDRGDCPDATDDCGCPRRHGAGRQPRAPAGHDERGRSQMRSSDQRCPCQQRVLQPDEPGRRPLPCRLRGSGLSVHELFVKFTSSRRTRSGSTCADSGAGGPFPSKSLPSVPPVPPLAHLLPVGKRHEDVDRHDRLAVPAYHQLRHVPRRALRSRRPRKPACRRAQSSRSPSRPRS